MQPRLSPKHKHQIISHSELRLGRPGKQSDGRMYRSSREGGGAQSGVMINLVCQLSQSVTKPERVCTRKAFHLRAYVCEHACERVSHINTTNTSYDLSERDKCLSD